MKDFFRLLRNLRPYRNKIGVAVILLLVASAASLVQPKISQWIVDKGIRNGNIQFILIMIGVLLAAAAVGGLLNYLSGYFLIQSAQGFSYDLRNRLFRHITDFSFANFDRWRTGELMVRLNSDVNTVRMFIRMGFFMLFQSLMLITGSLFAMFQTDTHLAGLLTIIMGSALLLFVFLARFLRPLFLKVREALDSLNNSLQENLAGAKLVRAFSRQEYEMKGFDEKNRGFYRISLKAGIIIGVLMPLLMLIGNGALLTAVWQGGLRIGRDMNTYDLASVEALTTLPAEAGVQVLTLGELLAFSNYAMMAIFPLIMLAMILSFLAMAVASAKRIQEVLDTVPSVKPPAAPLHLEDLRGRIEFKDVCFHYGDGIDALEPFSLTIEAGERIGIIGTTGSGKSSLVNLIPRFYDVCGGSVSIDGYDVRDLDLQFLRRNVTVVLQDSPLFTGSIRSNIAFADPSATKEAVEEAARIAKARDFILSKEAQWDELLGQRGQGLSGGQQQRVTIARALLAHPRVLILDDVTSALDLKTETDIIDALYSRKRETTTIIISQKVNTVKRADRILVMDDGKIIGRGTHEELEKNCETYRAIAKTQRAQVE